MIDNIPYYTAVPDDDNDRVPDAADVCLGTVIPEPVPTGQLGVNRFALTDDDAIFDTTPPKGKGPRKVFTRLDTAGCSCGQIIEALGLGEGDRKFGCSSSALRQWMEMVHPEDGARPFVPFYWRPEGFHSGHLTIWEEGVSCIRWYTDSHMSKSFPPDALGSSARYCWGSDFIVWYRDTCREMEC